MVVVRDGIEPPTLQQFHFQRKNTRHADKTSATCLSVYRSPFKEQGFAPISASFQCFEVERTNQKTKWRSNSRSNRCCSFGEKYQRRRRKESGKTLANLTLFSSCASKFDFAILPRKCNFRCYILSYLIDNKVNGGETGIRTLDTLRYTRFPSVRLQPLGHLSGL